MKSPALAIGVLLTLASPIGGRAAPVQPMPEVRSYRLELDIAPRTHRINGRATIAMAAPAGASASDTFTLDLADALEIRSVSLNQHPATFSHDHDRLAIRRPAGDRPRDGQDLLTIEYAGAPNTKALQFATRGGAAWVASYGLPYSARQWWPCFDTPAVKAATADVFVAVPHGLSAVSNGRLVAVKQLPDGRAQFHWHEGHPIYADVLSVAAGPYVRVDRHYRSITGRDVPLEYFFFPDDGARGEQAVAIVPRILRAYEDLFGPYPFADEKYGLVEVAYPSFREHQTIPSLGAGLLTGRAPIWNVGDLTDVIAHDLAHQWFGDDLTITSWSDAWLNEGFATYATALWRERQGGRAAYDAYLQGLSRDGWDQPVYVADAHDLGRVLSPTTFNKGAAALAALRQRIGDRAFLQALRDYVRAHRDGHVTTAIWEEACERASGKSLADFFRRWISSVRPPSSPPSRP